MGAANVLALWETATLRATSWRVMRCASHTFLVIRIAAAVRFSVVRQYRALRSGEWFLRAQHD